MGSNIYQMRNERGEIATDTVEMQEIIRVYYEQLYTNRLDNLDEMDKLETQFSKN